MNDRVQLKEAPKMKRFWAWVFLVLVVFVTLPDIAWLIFSSYPRPYTPWPFWPFNLQTQAHAWQDALTVLAGVWFGSRFVAVISGKRFSIDEEVDDG